MRLMKCILAGAMALVFSSVAAMATTLNQTVLFAGQTDFSNSTGTPQVLLYFDSNLGTLNSITFSSSYSFISTITISNTSSSSASGSVRTQSGAQFQSQQSAITQVLNAKVNNDVDPVDGNAVTVGFSTLSPIAYDIRGNSTNFVLPSGAQQSFTSSGSGSMSPTVDTALSDLSAFTQAGGGSFTPTLNTLTSFSRSGNNVDASQSTTARGSLTISYNYTAAPPVTTSPSPVPEPTSILLLSTGLAGLGAMRRRFR